MTVHDAEIYLRELAKNQSLAIPDSTYVESDQASEDYTEYQKNLAAIRARYPGLTLGDEEVAEFIKRAESWTLWAQERQRE